jgi:hypothetical protein
MWLNAFGRNNPMPVVYMSAQAIDRDRGVPGSVFVAKPYQHIDILSACQLLRER